MRVFIQRTSWRVFACLAAFATAGLSGLAAGFQARPLVNPVPSAPQISVAEVIDSRFPGGWDADNPAAAVLAFAASDGEFALFDPNPIYSGAQGNAAAPAQSAGVTKLASAGPVTLKTSSVAVPHRPVHRSNAVLNDSQLAGIKRRLNLTPEQE